MKQQFYPKFYQTISGFYQKHERAKQIVFWADKLATVLVFLSYFTGFLLLVIDRTHLFSDRFLSFLFYPFFSLACVSFLRVTVHRKRPYENGVTPLFEKLSMGNSFPSRHAASASAIAMSLIPILTPLAVIAFICCAVFLYTRTVLGWHYPSDVLTGGLLGVAIYLF